MTRNRKKLNRDSHIAPTSPIGAEYIRNTIDNSEQLNLSFLKAFGPSSSDDWISLFKSNLKFSKRTDQNWSTKLAESYFKELNRQSKKFNSSMHNYEELFDKKEDKILFLNQLSPLIQNLVYKRKVEEKNPILVIENQNPLIQNYIKIARENIRIEGLGKESLDSSGSSINDDREINKIIIIAREKFEFLGDFLKRHYHADDINMDKKLEEIKTFLKENEKHVGATPSPSSTNRYPQSPLLPISSPFPKPPLFPKSPTAFSRSRSSELSPLKSKMVVLENLLKELKKTYIITKDSERRAKLFVEPETPRAQSPSSSPSTEKLTSKTLLSTVLESSR